MYFDYYSHSAFWLPLLVFKIWMLADALQRGSGTCGGSNYWFLICWVPFGDWVYFFAVKLRDPDFAKFTAKLFVRKPSLEQLRYNLKNSPSTVNKVFLATALIYNRDFEEASHLLKDVIKGDEKNREANYLLGICLVESGNPLEAEAYLERVVEADMSFRNYSVATELVSVYGKNGKGEKALEFLRKAAKKTRRLALSVELAKRLFELGEREEARTVITGALEDYAHAPRFVRRQDRSAAKIAKTLIRQIHAEESTVCPDEKHP